MASNSDGALTVPSQAVAALMHYYDSDAVVQRCEQVLMDTVFATPKPWFVDWNEGIRGNGSSDAQHLSKEDGPRLFNSDWFLDQLKIFLIRARAMVRVVGACAFWYRRDVAAWVHDCIHGKATRTTLPFGLIEPDAAEYTLEPSRPSDLFERTLRVNLSHSPAVQAAYGIGVFNEDFRVLPVEWEVARLLSRHMVGLTNRSAAWAAHHRIPKSLFYDLIRRDEECNEARFNLMNADHLRANPRVLLQMGAARAGTTVSATEMSERDLYTHDTLLQAQNAIKRREGLYSLAEASAVLQHMADVVQGVAGVGHGGGRTALREQARREYGRPDALEDVVLLPDMVELARAEPPAVLNDAHALQAQYVAAVTGVFGVPLSLYYNGSYGRTQTTSHTASEQLTERHAFLHLEHQVKKERLLLDAIWRCVYKEVFGNYEMEALVTTVAYVEDELARRHLARQSALTPAHAFEMLTATLLEDEAPPADDEKPLRVYVSALRRYMKQLRSNTHVAGVGTSLVFPGVATSRQISELRMQIDLYDRGLVEPRVLERSARIVYGDGIKLRKPPPDLIAPPAAKRARKAADAGTEEKSPADSSDMIA